MLRYLRPQIAQHGAVDCFGSDVALEADVIDDVVSFFADVRNAGGLIGFVDDQALKQRVLAY
ncbi:MAG TPA: hypothetical protein QF589_05540 [Anaerolineales bacterium]|jgi:hypothetical protein|nr:hypothetical protein [Anaerolineales bacterium]HJN41553.1 hypothetical protein [Anaerolineales bacterium]|tara:strand:+ start:1050 stop:1235 length:186 start_codon:yes stop_codon:yes gene_type:complete